MRESALETLAALESLLADAIGLELEYLVVGVAIVVLLALSLLRLRRRWRRRREMRRSRTSHERASRRAPPVALGDVATAGVHDFTTHHTGERHAVVKVEGFVLFVENVPDEVSVGDVIRCTVLSFNRGETSASATFLERA